MSSDRPSGKIVISLEDPATRATWEGAQVTAREVEQWPSWKRGGDAAEQDGARRAFRARWDGFMRGGWEALAAAEPATVEAARIRAGELLPAHPDAIRVAELVARMVDIEKRCTQEQLFAALLMMERHGHAVLAAGWAYRPPPRVPRRGHCLEDMFLLLGYAVAREPSGDGG